MMDRDYQMCTNCVMDTTDSKITFDEHGWCDWCHSFHKNILPNWHPNAYGIELFTPILEKIKKEGKNRSHVGLKPLIFHVDAGWNSQISANNIARIIDGLGLDLYTTAV